MQNHVRRFFTDHDARSVRVSRDQRRHDRRIGDSKTDDPVNAQLVIDDGPRIARGPHLAGADVVVYGVGVVPDDALPVLVGVRLVVLAVRVRVAEEL